MSTLKNLDFEKPNLIGATTYLTHNFHPYPAKFIPQVPKTAIQQLTNEGDYVLDPFCGCGTTIVEARLANRHAIGVDLNPIASLITKVKSTPIQENEFNEIKYLFKDILEDLDKYYNNKETSMLYSLPTFHNRDHWFKENILHELAIIKAHISNTSISNYAIRNFLLCTFSSIIVKVSNQESDTRYAAKDKPSERNTVYVNFLRKFKEMKKRMLSFSKESLQSNVQIQTANSENLNFLADNSIDLIVTSPPYANTYDYYLYHKFRMIWLGFDVKSVQNQEIGSRNKHSSQKKEIEHFTNSLTLCIKEFKRVLKFNKYAVLVIGDSIIRGELHRADEFTEKIAIQCGLTLIKKTSSNLQKNTRMFNPKFTNSRKMEHIMVFQNTK